MNAEQAYLFRHVLVRDAAYELQLPAERAALHDLAAGTMLAVLPPPLDAVAHEIAAHLRLGGRQPELERQYTLLAARYAHGTFSHSVAIPLLERLAEIGTESNVIEAYQLLYAILRAHRNDQAGAMRYALLLVRYGRARGVPVAVAQGLNYLAGLADDRRAVRLWRRAFRLAVKAQAWMVAAISIGNLGSHYTGTRDHRRARRLFVSSIRLNEKAGNEAGVGFFLSSLSGQLRHLGDLEGALAASRRSIAILEGMGAKRYLPTAYGHYAAALDVLGRFDESEHWLAKAYTIADEIQLQREFWKLAVHRALVALERGRVDDAQAYWQRALAWLRDNGTAADIQQARADLRAACARLAIPDDGRW